MNNGNLGQPPPPNITHFDFPVLTSKTLPLFSPCSRDFQMFKKENSLRVLGHYLLCVNYAGPTASMLV